MLLLGRLRRGALDVAIAAAAALFACESDPGDANEGATGGAGSGAASPDAAANGGSGAGGQATGSSGGGTATGGRGSSTGDGGASAGPADAGESGGASGAGDGQAPAREFSCAERAPEHPEWLLCDDFEAGQGDFAAWLEATPFHEFDGAGDEGRMTLSADHVRSGGYSLHMPASAASGYRGASADWLQCAGEYQSGCALGGHDALYFRAWVRFASDHVFVHHFLRIGGRYTAESPYNDTMSGYWFNGTAGCLPDGTTHMDMTLEVDRSSASPRHHTGYFYSYHPGMPLSNCGGSDNDRFEEICNDCNRWDHIKLEPKCDNADKRCYWGEAFEVSDAELAANPERYTFPKGEWFCVEMAMKANTPGVSDGEMRYWINDVPAHAVTDMRWRTVDTLALNKVSLQHYITGTTWFGTPPQSNQVWFDDVVISTERIGCE